MNIRIVPTTLLFIAFSSLVTAQAQSSINEDQSVGLLPQSGHNSGPPSPVGSTPSPPIPSQNPNPQYTITTASSPANAGTITGKGTYTANSTVTVTANPDSCFQFSKWTEDGKSITENPYTFTITNNVSLVAEFTPLQYTITTTANPAEAGTITGTDKKECGSKATLIATAKPGFKFVEWIDLANNAAFVTNKAAFTFDVDSARDLQAVFEDTQPPKLTVSSPTPGAQVPDAAFTISGTVSDNVRTAYVAFSLNGAAWAEIGFAIPATLIPPPPIVILSNLPLPIVIGSNPPPPIIIPSHPPPPIVIASNPPAIPIVSNPPPPIVIVSNIPLPIVIGSNLPSAIVARDQQKTANVGLWAARVSLKPNSQNTLWVYAADTSGNLTKTNKITFDCTAASYAPASISGFLGMINLTNEPMFELSFGADSFAQTDFNTNRGAIGLYNYVPTGSNTAQFILDYTGPVSRVGSSGPINLSFSDAYTAALSDTDGDSGTIFFSDAPDFAPSTLDGYTTVFTSSTETNYSNTNIFGDGTFTGEDSAGTVYSGEYNFIQCSPNAVVVQQVITNPALYFGASNLIVLTYGHDVGSNTYFYTGYGNSGGAAEADYGVFVHSAQTTNPGYAPATLTGLELQFKPPHQGAYSATFGNATFAVSSGGAANTGVAVYTYTLLGPDTGEISWSYLPPYNQYPDFPTSAATLTFAKGGSAHYTNEITEELGTVDFIRAPATVPASLVGKTGVATYTGSGKKLTNKISFGYGTFTSGNSSGTYTFIPASPSSALVQLTYTDAADAGLVEDLQINFTSSQAGSFVLFQADSSVPEGAYGSITFSNTEP